MIDALPYKAVRWQPNARTTLATKFSLLYATSVSTLRVLDPEARP